MQHLHATWNKYLKGKGNDENYKNYNSKYQCYIICFMICRMKNIIDTEEVEYAKNYVVPEMTRFCQDKRSEGSEFNFDYEPSRRACENIVEGLDKLQHGVSKYHFMSGSQDTEPKHDKVFDFTCYGRIGAPLTTYHDQLVPPEIKELDSAASVNILLLLK